MKLVRCQKNIRVGWWNGRGMIGRLGEDASFRGIKTV